MEKELSDIMAQYKNGEQYPVIMLLIHNSQFMRFLRRILNDNGLKISIVIEKKTT